MNIDLTGFVDAHINNELLKHKDIAPLVNLLNKYGIKGTKAMEFLMELNVVGNAMGGHNAVDNTDG